MKRATLEAAYLDAKRNRGASGSDGETFERIEEAGREEFLAVLAAELSSSSYKPRAYRRREIPKGGGRVRTISIPTIRDRVVQGAIRLVLEPIFEADFSDSSYGARPGRSAHQAIGLVRQGLLRRKHRVVDVDLSRFFDCIRHDRILEKVAGRGDATRFRGAVLRLVSVESSQPRSRGASAHLLARSCTREIRSSVPDRPWR